MGPMDLSQGLEGRPGAVASSPAARAAVPGEHASFWRPWAKEDNEQPRPDP